MTADPLQHVASGVPHPRVSTVADSPDDLVRTVRVGRQAIFDANRQVSSFQLLFRAREGISGMLAGEQATSQVIASTFGTFGLDVISDGRPVFINFTRAFLTGVIPLPVEPENVIVEVVDQQVADHELMLGLDELRAAGYRIAVGNYRGEPARSGLLEVADFVGIDVMAVPSLHLVGLVGAVRAAGATLLATNIEDEPTFAHCESLGFELFQGTHLGKPAVVERRTLSPSQLICVRLLNELGDPDLSMNRIEQMVGSDPGLTLRMLRTANSATSGAKHEVTSLRQAMVLVGPRKLRSWVVLTLLEGAATKNRSDDLWNVLARAQTCQRLATHTPEMAFTVGLLTGAAELLGTDVTTVADGSGIGAEARTALIEGGGEAGRALTAVLAHERQDVDGIERTGLAAFDVSRAYLESLSASISLVHDLTGE